MQEKHLNKITKIVLRNFCVEKHVSERVQIIFVANILKHILTVLAITIPSLHNKLSYMSPVLSCGTSQFL